MMIYAPYLCSEENYKMVIFFRNFNEATALQFVPLVPTSRAIL